MVKHLMVFIWVVYYIRCPQITGSVVSYSVYVTFEYVGPHFLNVYGRKPSARPFQRTFRDLLIWT